MTALWADLIAALLALIKLGVTELEKVGIL